jgi:hypothetical protein
MGLRDYVAFRRSGQITRISPHKRLQRGYMALFERAYFGEWNGWDIRSTFHIWNNDGVCIIPNGNLVTNIGFGPDAEHTKSEHDPLANLPFRPLGPIVHPSDRSVHEDYDIRGFDTYSYWMSEYARRSKYRRIPFSKLARTAYSALVR